MTSAGTRGRCRMVHRLWVGSWEAPRGTSAILSPVVLCRPQCLQLRCAPNMVSCPFPKQIAALKKKKKTVTFVNYRHLYSNSDLCGSWKKRFWEQGILRCVLRAPHRSIAWTVWTLCFAPGWLWDLVNIAEVLSASTNKATLQKIKFTKCTCCHL